MKTEPARADSQRNCMKYKSTRVAITTCSTYDQPDLDNGIDRLLSVAGNLPNLHSCNVLVKPNLITARYGTLPCTEAAVILSVSRWMLDHGARVIIGDSPVFGTATSALRTLGVADQLLASGVRISNFSRGRKVNLASGEQTMLANEALDCDLLVNLPRVKTHAQTRLTLAIKNYFGCLQGLRKPWWHMTHGGENGDFCDRIIRLPLLFPPAINLVDGITAMHITGPIRGKPFPLGILAASFNPVAVDRALHAVLQVAPENSPLMAACRQAGFTGARLSQLSFSLLSPDQVQVSDFLLPEILNPIRFRIFRFMKNSVRRILLNSNKGK
jgi:uncharacterized protein (DUF362 family)